MGGTVQKREKILAGKSVWYSNNEDIEKDLETAWKNINAIDWAKLPKDEFAKNVARLFPAIWQVHPFREGNTRTVVMLITFFVEHYGFYFDQELISVNAGYVRNSFVLASLGEHSEYEDLETILCDAICNEPVEYTIEEPQNTKNEKYSKYDNGDYEPTKHEYIE